MTVVASEKWEGVMSYINICKTKIQSFHFLVYNPLRVFKVVVVLK